MGCNDTSFQCDGSTSTFRVMFKEPVEILPNTNYIACATLKVRRLSVCCCSLSLSLPPPPLSLSLTHSLYVCMSHTQMMPNRTERCHQSYSGFSTLQKWVIIWHTGVFLVAGPRLVLREQRTTQGDPRVCVQRQSDLSVHLRSRQQQWHFGGGWANSRNHLLHLDPGAH